MKGTCVPFSAHAHSNFFLGFLEGGGRITTLVLLVALSFSLFPFLYYISETNTFL